MDNLAGCHLESVSKVSEGKAMGLNWPVFMVIQSFVQNLVSRVGEQHLALQVARRMAVPLQSSEILRTEAWLPSLSSVNVAVWVGRVGRSGPGRLTKQIQTFWSKFILGVISESTAPGIGLAL